jgi:hypothetical protein
LRSTCQPIDLSVQLPAVVVTYTVLIGANTPAERLFSILFGASSKTVTFWVAAASLLTVTESGAA